MGLLGESAVRAIASAVREQTLAPERAALALAHVAREGYETPVEALRYDPNQEVAQAARGAGEQAETAAQHHREVSGAASTRGPRAFGRVLHRAITQRQLG